MTEFKEQSFGHLKFKQEKPAYRDLRIEDLIGEKETVDVNLPAQMLAQREHELQEAEGKLIQLYSALEDAARKWQETEIAQWQISRRSAVEFALALAERIIEVKVNIDPTVVEKAVEKLLVEKIPGERAVLILNPADALRLKEAKISQKILDDGSIFRIDEDADLSPGCAALDMETSRLDIDYRKQLSQLGEMIEIGDAAAATVETGV